VGALRGEACEYFNADDRAAELNGGSYLGISSQIRQTANREFEAFVTGCIERHATFAIETTLRSGVTFQQAELARGAGFFVEMHYVALRDLSLHLERVKARADAGGHSASEKTLTAIYRSSLGNLARAVREMDELRVYDNSSVDEPPKLVLEAAKGEILLVGTNPPDWLVSALDRFL
jgi:predicted ABC-type ATPase